MYALDLKMLVKKLEYDLIDIVDNSDEVQEILKKNKYALKMSLIKIKKTLDSHYFARENKRHIINMILISSINLSTKQININEVSFSIGRT